MAHRFVCSRYQRVSILEGPANASMNGIDYLEVQQKPDASGAYLTIQFVRNLGLAGLTTDNLRITGGVRFGPPTIVDLTIDVPDSQIVVETKGATDFSEYTFDLVKSSGLDIPPTGFDPELSEVLFDFKADCPSDFDCLEADPEPAAPMDTLAIDYLTKDYNSFRQLMLDRMSVTMPQWTERNPADLGVAIVETLAYAADYLSYYQDAVATETYLETARLRTSVKRHSRLLGYPMHEGCNARVFVHLAAVGNYVNVPQGTPMLIRRDADVVLPPSAVLNPMGPVFETMSAVTIWPDLNEVLLHSFFDTGCVLSAGATTATLWDQTGALSQVGSDGTLLRLKVNDLILFEEVCDATGSKPDADPLHRHVVRLTAVSPGMESILGQGEISLRRIIDISWSLEDALPFDLALQNQKGDPMTVVRGNIVLADHGQSTSELVPANFEVDGRLRLESGPVAWQGRARSSRGVIARGLDNKPVPFDPIGSAASAMIWTFADTFPCVSLQDGNGDEWLPQRDLLDSSPLSEEFVLEVDDTGTGFCRFGDGFYGMQPPGPLTPSYRLGNGSDGNVGTEAIAHICLQTKSISLVRNPLAATGGVDPELITTVKLNAPYAFRDLERAVIDADYATLAPRHPEIQKAVAFREWTGSWMTVVLLVDRKGGLPVDAAFQQDVIAFFDSYRMAGYDIEVRAPVFVPLDIAMTVCLDPDAIRAHVKEALFAVFGTGPSGMFNPDNWTFGQPVYLSEIIATAMQVPGVAWVDLDPTPPKQNRFQKFGRPANGEYAAGLISVGTREIARLDNSPNNPENGRIQFFVGGGR